MRPHEISLCMVRGDTSKIGICLKNLETEPDAIYMTVKRTISDEEPSFQKSLDNGIIPDESEEGKKFYIVIEPGDTQNLTPAIYVYDIEITVNGDTFTPITGRLVLVPDVTQH